MHYIVCSFLSHFLFINFRKLINLKRISVLPTKKQHMPYSYMMPEIPPETVAVKFSDPDSVDLSTLNCDDFVEWLRAKNFSTENCQAFKGSYSNQLYIIPQFSSYVLVYGISSYNHYHISYLASYL